MNCFLKRSEVVFLSGFKTENHPVGWATYSPGRPGNSSAYAIVFGCYFTSGVRQKTTICKGGQPILLTGQQAAQHTQ